jgi:pimeloyl-ACP methyl ester carboxylesterase
MEGVRRKDGMPSFRLARFTAAMLMLGASCGGESPRGATPTTVTPAPTEETTLAPVPGEEDEGRKVAFQAEDGTKLLGRLWGEGEVGVVLAHGFSELTGQDDWLPFPGILAAQGYHVLTFNFRGFCSTDGCSGRRMELGNNWLDVVAATELLEERGAKRIFLIGGSMGGIAVFRAAETALDDVEGIVSISTPQFPSQYYPEFDEPPENDVTEARLQAIQAPKLFIAGDGDAQLTAAGVIRFADDARSMAAAAAGDVEVLIVDSTAHSHELVTAADPSVVVEVREAILRFLAEHA